MERREIEGASAGTLKIVEGGVSDRAINAGQMIMPKLII